LVISLVDPPKHNKLRLYFTCDRLRESEGEERCEGIAIASGLQVSWSEQSGELVACESNSHVALPGSRLSGSALPERENH